jgi:hypothetical protein
MGEYVKGIIDLKELPDYKFIQFLRIELLNVQGYGPTFFGHVRYARNDVEQKEGLPMDMSKGIFTATLRDDQLQGITRDELEKTLQEAAIEITKIVRKDPNLKKLMPHYGYSDNNEKCFTKKSNDPSVNILKNILKEYTYLIYDENHSEPPHLLRCQVKDDPKRTRHAKDIFEIVQKLRTETGEHYSVGSYGGSFHSGDNLDEVWTSFSLRLFDFEEKSKVN